MIAVRLLVTGEVSGAPHAALGADRLFRRRA